jgi:hypothetical protein
VSARLCAVPLFFLWCIIPAHAASLREYHALPGFRDVRAYVTGYNTVPGQTDDTPCTAASGADICGRTDAVACPRGISFGTILQIRGMLYVCEDRLAKKYDSRFDISCDKDTYCPPLVTGWTVIRVFGVRALPVPALTDTRLPAIAATALDPAPADAAFAPLDPTTLMVLLLTASD